MSWNTFWTSALCIAAIAFCAGIYREMQAKDARREAARVDREPS